MAKLRLPICSIPAVGTRDGIAGAAAKFYLPNYGYWTVSGEVLSWENTIFPQDRSMRLGGVSQPNTFRKDCCVCSGEGENLLIEYRQIL